jgi:eukaryotic-like serine/threonine-protein kinase
MNRFSAREEVLFTDALAQPPAERGAFLAKACGANVDLLAHLVALVAAHGGPESLMASAPIDRAAIAPEEKPADVIGRYKLLEKLGEGGCGAVWAAEQREPVKRRVALKIIKLGMDTRQVIARFEAERQALAMMDHPNIAKMLDAGATETGRPYFVMELVRGIPITAYCDENSLTTAQRLDLMIKVCHAIQHAHQKGIIHRDIKPSNVLITLHDGTPVPKVIDFGIAKATQHELTEKTIYTKFQQFIGTPAYMSPEQAEMSGLDIDTRSDVYSLGVLLYELVTGRTPFDSKELLKSGVDEIRRTIREKEPARPSARIQTLQAEELTTAARRRSTEPRKLVASVQGDLDWIVMKCLEKDRTRRYEAATGLAADVQRFLAHEPVLARPPSAVYRTAKFVRRHRIAFAASSAVVGVIVIGAIVTTTQAVRALNAERTQNDLRQTAERAKANEAALRRAAETEQQRSAKMRWARETALPEINRLIKKDDIAAAFALAREAEQYIPTDPALTNLWPQISSTETIETTPPGADIYIKPYRKPAAEWEYVGKSPLKDIRLARDFYRWRYTKEGYDVVERAGGPLRTASGVEMQGLRVMGTVNASLPDSSSVPTGMLRIRGSVTTLQDEDEQPVSLADYWIDKYEVTNRSFKKFVDQGGYASERFWKQSFAEGDKILTWAEAMDRFRDTTGRPGPAMWRNGTYAEEEADHPVTGVSWFEAAAYAEFVGKRLPSIQHWRQAALNPFDSYIVPLSNFGERSAPVGQYQGMSATGTYDMAGNAKEWCWNGAGAGKRYILGGAWGEPEYMSASSDAQSPFTRSPTFGFRCIKLDATAALSAAVDRPALRKRRDYSGEKPVSDAAFDAFKQHFTYIKRGLNPQTESVDDAHPQSRKEKVSFQTAYKDERMAAFVFLPKRIPPPYQAIVLFPGSTAQRERSSDNLVYELYARRLAENGRAVIYPIYEGSFERGPRTSSVTLLDWRIHLVKDVGRAIDYLETRPDIVREKIGYVGYSWGAGMGLMVSAVEPRIKTNVLVIGGFSSLPKPQASEADFLNYAPRVKIPTLMLNGRYDYSFPLETAQLPLFQALGAAPQNKRHVVYDTGHSVPENQSFAEIFAWFDRYLGPVK